MAKDRHEVLRNADTIHLFGSAEELWFWFVSAQMARDEGAICRAGQSETPRPCEPNDILQIISKLHRNRQLMMDHFRILAHYGNRGFAPDMSKRAEIRAHTLWREAFTVLRPIFESKGFLKPYIWLVPSR